MVLVAILVVVALIVVNALYVAAEFAAVSVRRSRIQQLAADGNPLAAWLLPVLESPKALDRYIGACQIGITLSSLVLGAYAQQTFAVWLTPYFAELGGLQQIAAQSTSTAVVLLTLTVGRSSSPSSCPKSLALQYPTQVSLYTLIPMIGVAVDLPAVHQVPQRHRAAVPAGHRLAVSGPPAHSLARGDRAPHRREPRRRPARARRASPTAARAASQSAARPSS